MNYNEDDADKYYKKYIDIRYFWRKTTIIEHKHFSKSNSNNSTTINDKDSENILDDVESNLITVGSSQQPQRGNGVRYNSSLYYVYRILIILMGVVLIQLGSNIIISRSKFFDPKRNLSSYHKQQQQQQHQQQHPLQQLLSTNDLDNSVKNTIITTGLWYPETRRLYDSDNMQSEDGTTTTTTVAAAAAVQQTNTLVEYFETMNGGQNNMILLQWGSDGTLLRHTPVTNRMWFAIELERESYYRTKPSPYGSVAMILNTDILSYVNWTIIPPIPLLTYTLPDNARNLSDRFHYIPNPYDIYGFNSFCSWRIQKVLDIENEPVSYEMYLNRSNTIAWRGEPHDDEDIARRLAINLSQQIERDIEQGIEHQHLWFDAADTTAQPHKKMEMEDMVAKYRYQMDIGGVSGTSWGGLRWKLCTGSLTFKVDTFSKDWWHPTIQPWVHYIPVKSDLSNLYEVYQWAEKHPQQAYKISQRGMETCQETIPKEKSEEYVQTLLMEHLEPIPTADLLQDVEDIYKHHLQDYFTSPENDKDYNDGLITTSK